MPQEGGIQASARQWLQLVVALERHLARHRLAVVRAVVAPTRKLQPALVQAGKDMQAEME
jgi:hypothetical protein